MASSSVVSLNVGGELFQTTEATLSRAGASSPLASLAPSPPDAPHFLDRDPRLFALILSFLRRGRLASPPPSPALLTEARHLGLEGALLASLSPASAFSPLSLRPAALLPLTGRVAPSAVAISPSASLFAAHGGVVTSFDAALASRASVLTPLPAVDSLVAVSPALALAGARDFPGVHLCRFLGDDAPATASDALSWADSPSASVLSMAATPASEAASQWLFASFESARRNSSAVVAFDLNSLSPVVEIGRKEVFGADVEAAIPPTKLGWLAGHSLLLAAGSHSGPAGMVGDIRLWDIRASSTVPVWEVREKEDCFADVAASDSLSALFKVGASSGEVFMADLRRLSSGDSICVDPWVCIGDQQRAGAATASRRKDGSNCRVECYRDWVFVARGTDVEVWSQVEFTSEAVKKKAMRRNWLGNGPSMITAGSTEGMVEKAKIVSWAFGGSRMALARVDQRSIEVWDNASGAISVNL